EEGPAERVDGRAGGALLGALERRIGGARRDRDGEDDQHDDSHQNRPKTPIRFVGAPPRTAVVGKIGESAAPSADTAITATAAHRRSGDTSRRTPAPTTRAATYASNRATPA